MVRCGSDWMHAEALGSKLRRIILLPVGKHTCHNEPPPQTRKQHVPQRRRKIKTPSIEESCITAYRSRVAGAS